MQRQWPALAAGMTLALGFAFHLHAQAPASAPNRRVEGDWVRVDFEGAGSFGGLNATIPPAQLLPGAAAGMGGGRGGGRGGAGGGARGGGQGGGQGGGGTPSGAPNAAGVPYVVVQQPCAPGGARGNGALLLNPDSGGIHLIEQKDEVILAGERGGVRHIWMDNRPHPSVRNRQPTGAGHSVGHYEGDVLVVETTGLTPGAVTAGGMRSAETILVERFEVSPDGKRMTVTYTWDDPKIYAKPHTYHYVFDRAPEIGGYSYAMEEWCDSGDPIEQQSIVPPKQLP